MAINSLRPLKPDRFDYWKAQHLLNRAGFGGTPGQVRALANMGLRQAVDYIVDFDEIADDPVTAGAFDSDIMRPRTQQERETVRRARQSGDEAAVERFRQMRQAAQRADRRQIVDVQKWWLRRLIETPRPLEEKLTLFWHGHFATSYRTIEDSYHMYMQNQLFRKHAAGRFSDLVFAIVRDPAMIRYLNNNQNRRQSPNENLARELMELFVLGEGNEYTEADIKEGARALTGYTYQDDGFVFRENLHDAGQKRILGKTGNWDGDDFCRIILSTKVASQFLSWKLYRYFINDLPGDPEKDARGYILKLARLMRDSNYEMKPVLRTLFLSEHFYDDQNMASLLKSPTQLIVQGIRSLRTPVRSLSALVSAADLMGQNILFPPSVKGWDGGRSWINTSTMFVRQNVMIYLLTGRRPETYAWETDGSSYDAMHLIEHLKTPDGRYEVTDTVTYLLRFSFGVEPDSTRVQELAGFIESHGGRINNNVLIAVLSLITAMPEYQLC